MNLRKKSLISLSLGLALTFGMWEFGIAFVDGNDGQGAPSRATHRFPD